jgi:hypothetical protein
VITVTVLLAAGIAVYESPQVRQWIEASRRKIAIALHNLGDEINPPRQPREDISMMEDVSDEAEERRRKAREEILRRRGVLESQRRRSNTGSSGSFDALVDKDGRLKEQSEGLTSAKATATDANNSSGITHRRHDADPASDVNLEQLRSLRLQPPSEVSSARASGSHVDLTPTSEFPDSEFEFPNHNDASQDLSRQSDYMSAVSSRMSSGTEDGEPDFYYAHPNHPNRTQEAMNSWLQGPSIPARNENLYDASTAASIASSMSHINHEAFEASSDGTMSEAELVQGVHTPVSWSEVGSVISSNDGSHH